MKKRTLSILLTLALCMGLVVPAMASGGTTVTTPDGNITITNVVRQSVYEDDIVDEPGVGYGSWHHQTIYWVPDTGTEIYLNGAQTGEEIWMESFYITEEGVPEEIGYMAEYSNPFNLWMYDEEKNYPELYTEEFLTAVEYNGTIALIGFVKSDAVSEQPVTPPTTPTDPGYDTNYSSWAADAVEWAMDTDNLPYVIGVWKNEARRQQYAAILVNMVESALGEQIPAAEGNPFKDCQDSYVKTAYKMGIVSGTGADTFNPDGSLTREQLAVMLYNAIRYIEKETGRTILTKPGSLSAFTDKGQVSSWAQQQVGVITANGFMSGMGNNMLSPKTNATVEQATVLAHNVLKGLR